VDLSFTPVPEKLKYEWKEQLFCAKFYIRRCNVRLSLRIKKQQELSLSDFWDGRRWLKSIYEFKTEK